MGAVVDICLESLISIFTWGQLHSAMLVWDDGLQYVNPDLDDLRMMTVTGMILLIMIYVNDLGPKFQANFEGKNLDNEDIMVQTFKTTFLR